MADLSTAPPPISSDNAPASPYIPSGDESGYANSPLNGGSSAGIGPDGAALPPMVKRDDDGPSAAV